jgi:hypothetical protein
MGGGNKLVALGDLARPQAAHPLQQPGEAGVDASVALEREAHAIAARLELAALAGARARFRNRLRKALRARGAELNRQEPLHPSS